MGALGFTRGKSYRFVSEAHQFAAAHGCALKACGTGDAKRKGKVERPFSELKASFLEEVAATAAPSSIPELNARAAAWLASEVHARPHRVTGVPPALRLQSELPLLGALPRIRFDTARIEPRHVGAPVPLIEVDGVPYSVPPELVGTMVEIRLPVDTGILEVRAHGSVVASHAVAAAGSAAVWDPAHRKAAEALALAPHHRSAKSIAVVQEWVPGELIELGDGDYEVDPPDLSGYDVDSFGCGCGSAR